MRFWHEDDAAHVIRSMNRKEVEQCRLYVSVARIRRYKEMHGRRNDRNTIKYMQKKVVLSEVEDGSDSLNHFRLQGACPREKGCHQAS